MPDGSKWDEDGNFVLNLLLGGLAPQDLWESDSPIWARPQEDFDEKTGERTTMFCSRMWKADKYLQVVGHTPMHKITHYEAKYTDLLSTDVFSTYSNGCPYGEEKFAIVDTVNKTWEYAKEEE